MVPLNTSAGERRAWEALRGSSHEDVCRRAAVSFDPVSLRYRVRSLGVDLYVDPAAREISSAEPAARLLLEDLRDLLVPSVLVYLATAHDVPLTGRLLKPELVRGGHLFSSGSHVLPLDDVAVRFGSDRDGFLARGRDLGAEPAPYGDVALRLLPLPRLPLCLALWLADDEFPARADLLLDSSCEIQAPVDLLWAVTTAAVLAMLRRP